MGELADEVQDEMMMLPLLSVSSLWMADPMPATQPRLPCEAGRCKAKAERAVSAHDPRTVPATPEVRQAVTTELTRLSRHNFARCAPKGDDANLIVTKMWLRLRADGALVDVGVAGQSGITDTNRRYADRHKWCAEHAIRMAAPFKNLPAEYYQQWKTWTLQFKTR